MECGVKHIKYFKYFSSRPFCNYLKCVEIFSFVFFSLILLFAPFSTKYCIRAYVCASVTNNKSMSEAEISRKIIKETLALN